MIPNIKYSISRQVAWLSLFPLLLMAVGLETFYLHDRFSALNEDMVQRGHQIARQLAAGSEYGVFARNADTLHDLADKTLQEPDVISVIILDENQKILIRASRPAAPDQMSPSTHDSNEHSMNQARADSLLKQVGFHEPIYDNGKTMLVYQPILVSQVMIDDAEVDFRQLSQTGAVLIELSWQATRKLKARLLWISIFASTLFILLTYVVTLIASRRITEPVEQLSSAIKSIGSGNLDTRIELDSCVTELCTLTDGINRMTADLKSDRDNLQQRIDDATQQLRELAFYDTLTHLPNRRLLDDRLMQSMATSKRSGRYGALMFLDLDNFKPINDLYGHAAGDLLLIDAANRISSCVREMDTVARFGGDEFVVLLGELSSSREESQELAHLVAEKIRTTVEQTYYITQIRDDGSRIDIQHLCSTSIGISLFMNHEATSDEIMKWADLAMYQAKQDGRNLIRFHTP